MKLKNLFIASGPLLASSTASATLLLHYTFDNDDAANSGSLGDGVVEGGSAFVDSTAGPAAGRAWQGNRLGANDAYISTGLNGIDLSMGASSTNGGVYTAMAWINWTGSGGSGDHMVFGAADGPGNTSMLHHGIRDDGSAPNAHFGHWGNDLNDAGVITPGEWTHLAFQYDGTDKVVYINGVESARGAGNPLASEGLPVIVGGHGRDAADPAGQSFNGLIDDVRIYDEALTDAQIMDVMTAIPEPSSTGLLALTGLLLLRRRR